MDINNDFWIETYDRNISKMIGFCFRYVSDRQLAEDLALDSFLVAMKKSNTFSISFLYLDTINLKAQFKYWFSKGNYSSESSYSESLNMDYDADYCLLWDYNGLYWLHKVIYDNNEKIYTNRAIGGWESRANYHIIELPIHIGYSYNKINPYIGFKYSLKMYNLPHEVEVNEDDGEFVTKYTNHEKRALINLKITLV